MTIIIPIDIIFELFKYLDHNDTKHFLDYIKNSNKYLYNQIISSLNKQINNKHQILNALEYMYYNIEQINTKKAYMLCKKNLFNLYIHESTLYLNILYNKIVKLYADKLNTNKKKFNNLSSIFLNTYFEEHLPTPSIQPKISTNNHIKLEFDTYLDIKDYLLRTIKHYEGLLGIMKDYEGL